jgi:hypothetical protein
MTPCGLIRDHGVANQVGSVMMKTILGFGVSVAALMAASAANATIDLNFEGIQLNISQRLRVYQRLL